MRYFMIFTYDGSNYGGYQKQVRTKTIQGEIEKVLKVINTKAVSIHSSGRTDAKVHAYKQTAHFDLEININPSNLVKAMNSMLPGDIYVRSITLVDDDFHARFNASGKEYVYKINLGDYNPFEKDYILQYNKPLDLVELERGLTYFEGPHNFKSFVKSNPDILNYNREIYNTKLERDGEYIYIYFRGNGFMRYMIRNMIGTLLEIGEGKRASDEIIKILENQNRNQAGKTANPEGLYLNEVFYDEPNIDNVNLDD